MVIVDKSMIHSDSSSSTNYPGKIPAGPDLPSSDVPGEEEEQEKDTTN